MLGAISHVDTFDYKPTLEKMHGQEIPPSVRNTQRLSTMSNGQSSFPLVAPLAKFQPRGQSGAWVSDLLPHIAGIVDELCFIKTMHTEHVNHDPAAKFLHTGFQLSGRPSIGAWVNYGLGSDNTNLPAFVVMSAGASQGVPLDSNVWASGFLPSHHQGVQFRADADPVLYVRNPAGIEMRDRRDMLDTLAQAGGHSASRVEGPRDSVAPLTVPRWPIACRLPCPKSLISRTNPNPSWRCTVPM